LRHSHKTWLIADGIPEIAQAKRLGHHLANRLVEVYSHVAPENRNPAPPQSGTTLEASNHQQPQSCRQSTPPRTTPA
jgi:hypothetical protein